MLGDQGLNGHCGCLGLGQRNRSARELEVLGSEEDWRGPISLLWSFRTSAVPCAAWTPGLVLQHFHRNEEDKLILTYQLNTEGSISCSLETNNKKKRDEINYRIKRLFQNRVKRVYLFIFAGSTIQVQIWVLFRRYWWEEGTIATLSTLG